MKKLFIKSAMAMLLFTLVFTACKKSTSIEQDGNEEQTLRQEATKLVEDKQQEAQRAGDEFAQGQELTLSTNSPKTIVQIVVGSSKFTALTAAAVKTGLASVLGSADINATVFAPNDRAFAKLPAPFNNAANIAAITDAGQIATLKQILLYHVLGTEVKSNQIAKGRSSAVTLKPAGTANDNTIYISNNYGLILVNGKSLVIRANIDASNGVIHVIDDVLLFPTQTIAQIAIGNPAFSSLVAALVKTNLAGVFTGAGDFTVFAPTDAAFAKLDAPFNSAANISAITSQAQIDALANILKYHVTASRYFAWDLGFFQVTPTIAAAPNNNLVTVLGFDNAHVKGNKNRSFATAHPANILATNGVIQIVNKVLLP